MQVIAYDTCVIVDNYVETGDFFSKRAHFENSYQQIFEWKMIVKVKNTELVNFVRRKIDWIV